MHLIGIWLASSLVQDPDAAAKKLLEAVVEKLKDSETIAFDAEQSLGANAQGKTTCYLRRPDKARFDSDGQRVLFDGTIQWAYFPGRKTYSQSPVQGVPPYKGYGPIYDLFFLKSSDSILKKGGLTIAKEKVGKAEFDVVTWKTQTGDTRLWIDKDKLLYRYDETWLAGGKPLLVTVEFSAWNLKPRLADDFFTFTPPKDAKEE